MLDVLSGFLGELRAAGLPISLRESIDAAEATDAVGLADRETLKSALAATVVKSPDHRAAFDSTFEVYFSIRPTGDLRGELAYGEDDEERTPTSASGQSGGDQASGDEHSITAAELTDLALAALSSGDMGHLSQVAKLAVALYGGVDSSRPVGVSYYLHRTLHGLAPEALLAALLEAVRADPSENLLATTANRLGRIGQDVARQAYTARLDTLRSLIEAEIRRLLVAERGAAAVAKSLRRPLLDDVDFMHATADELVAMRRTIFPLARILASRLARKRRHRRKGPLDFRATIRRSMSTGGVPLEPRFKSPHVNRPELFVLADVSGSVAAFARFTVHLVFAISTQFSKVRTAVFIDGVDEVTHLFNGATSLAEAIDGIAQGGRRRPGRWALRLRRGAHRLPGSFRPRDRAPDQPVDTRRRAEQLPPGSNRGARQARLPGAPGVVAEPGATRLLGKWRLDHERVRDLLRRGLRMPESASAEVLRRRVGLAGNAVSMSADRRRFADSVVAHPGGPLRLQRSS